MHNKSIGLLIVTLFVGVLIGGAFGQLLGLFIPVAEALVEPLIAYVAGPWDLNLVILVITFGFDVNINFFSILGIVGAWYYHKYSY